MSVRPSVCAGVTFICFCLPLFLVVSHYVSQATHVFLGFCQSAVNVEKHDYELFSNIGSHMSNRRRVYQWRLQRYVISVMFCKRLATVG